MHTDSAGSESSGNQPETLQCHHGKETGHPHQTASLANNYQMNLLLFIHLGKFLTRRSRGS